MNGLVLLLIGGTLGYLVALEKERPRTPRPR